MRIHFINGTSDKRVALLINILKSRGTDVTSSDINAKDYDKSLIMGANRAVYFKDEIPADNVELRIAELQQIPLQEPMEIWAEISTSYDKVIAVAGSHGKTIAAGMIGSILQQSDNESGNPTVHINADLIDYQQALSNPQTPTTQPTASHLGSNRYLVTEANEQKREFTKWHPHIGVILNANLDHTYYYIDDNDYNKAFTEFAQNCNFIVIANECKHLLQNTNQRMITVGIDGDYSASEITLDDSDINQFTKHSNKNERSYPLKTKFIATEFGTILDEYTINCFGIHNVNSALASIAVARELGISKKEIKAGLSHFAGIARRFEFISKDDNGILISDYAHHQAEIAASITAAKSLITNAPNSGKVRVLFQPYGYGRLLNSGIQLAQELTKADQVALVPIYAKGEPEVVNLTHQILASYIPNAQCYDTTQDAKMFLKQANQNDITILMGVGNLLDELQ